LTSFCDQNWELFNYSSDTYQNGSLSCFNNTIFTSPFTPMFSCFSTDVTSIQLINPFIPAVVNTFPVTELLLTALARDMIQSFGMISLNATNVSSVVFYIATNTSAYLFDQNGNWHALNINLTNMQLGMNG
jgi:hypothetical protein